MGSTTADRAAAEYAKRLASMAHLPSSNTPTLSAPSANPDSQTKTNLFSTPRFRNRIPRVSNPPTKQVRYPSESDRVQRQGHLLQRADGSALNLRGMYKGSTLFILLSGPSLKETPLHLLGRRGLVTMGVNNSWLMWKPDLWVSVDTPGRFADVGWLDPRILKMCPQAHAPTSTIRTMVEGSLVGTGTRVADCPNVSFFAREDDFNPSTFWSSPYAQWGCLKGKKDVLGMPGGRSVMLVALKMAYWLGFKKVFLVGADFKMSMDQNVSPYAWDENKDNNGRKNNNKLYDSLNSRFGILVAQGMPLEVYNCTKDSGLTAFPYVPFEEAVEGCTQACEKEVQTKGWYVK